MKRSVDQEPLWRVADVLAYLQCSRSALYRYMASPDFPKPHRAAGMHPRWEPAQIRSWALQRAA